MKLTGFYLIDPTKNAFVALDGSSGGYPYMVETLYKAQKFHTVAEAMKYRNSFLSGNYQNANAWKVVTLELIVTEVE